MFLRLNHFSVLDFLYRFPARVTAAIEAMCADSALGQSDGLYHHFNLVELQAGKPQTSCYLLYHALILWRVGLGILVELCILVAI